MRVVIASRYLGVVCALVGITLVPTFIHSYVDSTVHDGRATRGISTSLAGYAGVASSRSATWGKEQFDSDDWIDRIYARAGHEVRLSVIRSYDAKSLYHHPELAVSYGTGYVRSEVRRSTQRPEIPLHVLYTEADAGTTAIYALHYDDRFVDEPIAFQFRLAGELFFSGRKAMTLFFVRDEQVSVVSQHRLVASDWPSVRGHRSVSRERRLGTVGLVHGPIPSCTITRSLEHPMGSDDARRERDRDVV